MHSLPETLGTRPEIEALPDGSARIELERPARRRQPRRGTPRPSFTRARPLWSELRWPLSVYMASRFLYLLIALADLVFQHWSLQSQISNWDGVWYMALAGQGYPDHVSYLQTTLGFFPLYPLLAWFLSHVLLSGYVVAGELISIVGGFVSTVIVQRMATSWWDERAGRRAVLFFCLFPGSIVFSMIYSEGLLIPFALGSLYALQCRRWILAGLLAAAATAVGPVAFAIIPACAAASVIELRRRGWRDREARRSLLAPALAPMGAVLFGLFLWLWTGSPFASYIAQHHGWSERTTLTAMWHIVQHLADQIAHFGGLSRPGINLNYVSGLLGGAFLAWALVLMFRHRRRIPVPAIVWTLGIAFLTYTSSNVQPNPRMLICAAPALIVVAYELKGRSFNRLIAITTVLLFVMSYVSFVGTGLRP